MEENNCESLDLKNFVFELTDCTEEKSDWLNIMQFGRNWLLQHQSVLLEVVVRRAEYEADLKGNPDVRVSDLTMSILRELDMRFEEK